VIQSTVVLFDDTVDQPEVKDVWFDLPILTGEDNGTN